MGMFGTCQGRGLPRLWHKSYHRPPPRVNGPGHVSSFERGGGGGIGKGGHVSSFEGGVH